jgi:hypothetical protein
MSAHAAATSVRQDIVVDAPVDQAFSVFTQRFDAIKPREHNLLGVDIAETVFEPHVGGHIYDRGVDGSVCRWARVLERASEVEVRFIAETPERTRVELEHRHLERHGDGWESVREGVAGDGGWPLYLQRFAGVVEQAR